MAKTKTKPKAVKKKLVKTLDKAELFAHAYIQHMGNATAAAREVFGIESDDYATRKGAEYVGNSRVQEIVTQYMNARRAMFKKFIESTESHLNAVVQRLLQKLEDPNLSVSEIERCGILIARFAGMELSEAVRMKEIEAKSAGAVARARSEIPGLPPPGVQPGAHALTQHNDNRKTLFLLQPPPIPPGGVPTPALLAQWNEMYAQMGFKPGLDLPLPDDQNDTNGIPATSSPGHS